MAEIRWNQPVMARDQQWLFFSLDDMVPPDHGVRIVNAVLDEVDWTEWEQSYIPTRRGQPPLHPSLLAKALLYGLMRGLRSSRELEEATRERMDFMWLLEGRTIDHSSFAHFRVRFQELLEDLNRVIADIVCRRCSHALEWLVMDGTRMRANSDRHGARTAEGLDRLIAQCTQVLDERMAQMDQADAHGAQTGQEVAALQDEIEQLKARLAQYERAAEVARTRDGERRRKEGAKARPVSVPVTDPDATVMPNKEGGFDPNYTPTVAVDAASGAIVSATVVEGSQENATVMPAVEEAQRLGRTPEGVMADTGFACGDNLAQLAGEGIEACMPTGADFGSSNPANRPDPTQPVSEEQWDRLPAAGKKFRPSAFIYDAGRDEYRCPMGQALTPQGCAQRRNGGSAVTYKCSGCEGCPLAARCIPKGATARTLSRDPYQDLRDAAGRRMATEEVAEWYKKRAPLVEVVFARIKTHMGIRSFLLRGLDKVRAEWNWVCCAYNLKIILQMAQKQGIHPSKLAHVLSFPAQNRLQRLILGFIPSLIPNLTRSMTPRRKSASMVCFAP